MIHSITSLDNQEVRHATRLHKKKYRHAMGQFTADGYKTCLTLAQHLPIKKLFVTQQALEQYDIVAFNFEPRLVTPAIAAKISTASTPSGITALFDIPKPEFEVKAPGIVLAGITDPGNMGTLIRSAAAFNIKNIYCVETTDPFSPKCIRSTAGNIASVNIYQTSWPDLIDNKNGINLCSLVPTGGKHPQNLVKDNTLLVIGSESEGIPEEWIAQSDEKITISMPGNTESLNAAIAGTLGMYLLLSESK